MAFEAHKCNEKGCKGFIVFDNADFDYDNPPTVNGMYEFSNPKCTECWKEYKVVPYHVVIALDENEDIEFVEPACITEYERRELVRKYEKETNPHTKIEMFLNQRGYTYDIQDLLEGYRQKKDGYYVSYTMKDCIDNLELEINQILK